MKKIFTILAFICTTKLLAASAGGSVLRDETAGNDSAGRVNGKRKADCLLVGVGVGLEEDVAPKAKKARVEEASADGEASGDRLLAQAETWLKDENTFRAQILENPEGIVRVAKQLSEIGVSISILLSMRSKFDQTLQTKISAAWLWKDLDAAPEVLRIRKGVMKDKAIALCKKCIASAATHSPKLLGDVFKIFCQNYLYGYAELIVKEVKRRELVDRELLGLIIETYYTAMRIGYKTVEESHNRIIEFAEQALTVHTKNPYFLSQAGKAYSMVGKEDIARTDECRNKALAYSDRYIEAIATMPPGHIKVDCFWDVTNIYYAYGIYDKAATLCAQFIRQNSLAVEPNALQFAAGVFHKINDLKTPIDLYDFVIKKKQAFNTPIEPEVLLSLASIYDVAINKQILSEISIDPNFLVLAAEAHFRAKNFEQGLKYYRESLRLQTGEDIPAYADSLEKLGNWLDEVIETQQEMGGMPNAYFLSKRAECYNLAVEMGKDDITLQLLTDAGIAHMENNKLDKAIEFYKRAMKLLAAEEIDPALLYRVAEACLEKEDLKEALELVDKFDVSESAKAYVKSLMCDLGR